MLNSVASAVKVHRSPKRLGERVLEAGFVTDLQLKQALAVQSRTGTFLGQVFVDLGFVAAATIGSMLAQDFGVPYVDLMNDLPDPEAVKRVPEDLIRSALAIPMRQVGDDTLEVAMVDPLNVGAIDRFHLATGL